MKKLLFTIMLLLVSLNNIYAENTDGENNLVIEKVYVKPLLEKDNDGKEVLTIWTDVHYVGGYKEGGDIFYGYIYDENLEIISSCREKLSNDRAGVLDGFCRIPKPKTGTYTVEVIVYVDDQKAIGKSTFGSSKNIGTFNENKVTKIMNNFYLKLEKTNSIEKRIEKLEKVLDKIGNIKGKNGKRISYNNMRILDIIYTSLSAKLIGYRIEQKVESNNIKTGVFLFSTGSNIPVNKNFTLYKSENLGFQFEYPNTILSQKPNIYEIGKMNTVYIDGLELFFSIYDVSNNNKMNDFIINNFGSGCSYLMFKLNDGTYEINIKTFGSSSCSVNYGYFIKYDKILGKTILFTWEQSSPLLNYRGSLDGIVDSIKFIRE